MAANPWGKPYARLGPLKNQEARVPGRYTGEVPDSFFDELPEEELGAFGQWLNGGLVMSSRQGYQPRTAQSRDRHCRAGGILQAPGRPVCDRRDRDGGGEALRP